MYDAVGEWNRYTPGKTAVKQESNPCLTTGTDGKVDGMQKCLHWHEKSSDANHAGSEPANFAGGIV